MGNIDGNLREVDGTGAFIGMVQCREQWSLLWTPRWNSGFHNRRDYLV